MCIHTHVHGGGVLKNTPVTLFPTGLKIGNCSSSTPTGRFVIPDCCFILGVGNSVTVVNTQTVSPGKAAKATLSTTARTPYGKVVTCQLLAAPTNSSGPLGVSRLLTSFHSTDFHALLADPSQGPLETLGDLDADRIRAPFNRFCSPPSTCKRTRILSRTSDQQTQNGADDRSKLRTNKPLFGKRCRIKQPARSTCIMLQF